MSPGTKLQPENTFSALTYDEKKNILVVGSNHPHKITLPRRENTGTGVMAAEESASGHKETIVQVLYSKQFRQVCPAAAWPMGWQADWLCSAPQAGL